MYTTFYSECNSPQIKYSVWVLKPSCLQEFQSSEFGGEIERIMAHAYFPYFSCLFLVIVFCISFPPWLILCTKVEERHLHSCASNTIAVVVLWVLVWNIFFTWSQGVQQLKEKTRRIHYEKQIPWKRSTPPGCMLKFCINLPACPSSKGNPWLWAEHQHCEESSPSPGHGGAFSQLAQTPQWDLSRTELTALATHLLLLWSRAERSLVKWN